MDIGRASWIGTLVFTQTECNSCNTDTVVASQSYRVKFLHSWHLTFNILLCSDWGAVVWAPWAGYSEDPWSDGPVRHSCNSFWWSWSPGPSLYCNRGRCATAAHFWKRGGWNGFWCHRSFLFRHWCILEHSCHMSPADVSCSVFLSWVRMLSRSMLA